MLEPEAANLFGCRADEHHARVFTGGGERGVLAQQAVPRMHGLGAVPHRRGDDTLRDQVALLHRGRADALGRIGQRHVRRVRVGLRVDRHRADAEPAQRADDPAGDLAPVGDENATKHLRRIHHREHRGHRGRPLCVFLCVPL